MTTRAPLSLATRTVEVDVAALRPTGGVAVGKPRSKSLATRGAPSDPAGLDLSVRGSQQRPRPRPTSSRDAETFSMSERPLPVLDSRLDQMAQAAKARFPVSEEAEAPKPSTASEFNQSAGASSIRQLIDAFRNAPAMGT